MAVSEVVQICPSIETLCDPVKGRPKSSFKNGAKRVYHCPVNTCKYFNEDRYFEKMKFLRQHFVKVHKMKSFWCLKCGASFPLQSTLDHHNLTCGISYQCYCNAEYKAYEAFLTHFKRKHKEDDCVTYKHMMELLKANSTAQNFRKSLDHALDVKAIVLKHLTNRNHIMLKQKKNKTALSKETQTGMKMHKILPNVSNQSETSVEQQMKKTVSMQTTAEFFQKRRKRNKCQSNVEKITCSNDTKISFCTSSTQTTPVKDDQPNSISINRSSYKISKAEMNNSISKLPFERYKTLYPETLIDTSSFEETSSSSIESNLANHSSVKKMVSSPFCDLIHLKENTDTFCETCKEQSEDSKSDKSIYNTASFEITLQSSDYKDNSDDSNSANTFVVKRMISTDDPNLGLAPSYDLDDNKFDSEENKTDYSNSSEFLENNAMKTDFNLIMCSDSETQTPFEDCFDGSYMDNYTQTCDSLFYDLDFVDIETQTF